MAREKSMSLRACVTILQAHAKNCKAVEMYESQLKGLHEVKCLLRAAECQFYKAYAEGRDIDQNKYFLDMRNITTVKY